MTRLIVVDCTPYGAEPSGSRRRAEELLRRLPALLPDDVFEAHWARDGGGPPADLVADNLVHATVDVSCRGGAWRWWRRGRDLRRRRREAAYTHLLCDHGPVVAPRRVRNVVTVHDLRFLHGYGGVLRGLYARLRYGAVLRRAHAVVAVAPSLAAEARTRWHLPRVVVAANAVSPAFRPQPQRARSGVLVVSRDEPRKARGAAREAGRAVGLEVTVVESVRDDEVLRDHYASARWLLAPSLHEGYGMTVAEALACGTPVIASDHAAHRDLETLGARGIVFVPPPTRRAGGWSWPQAVEALRGPRPEVIRPPACTWDEAARTLADAIRGEPA